MISGLTACVSSTTSWPSTRALPDVGRSTVERILTSVVLPAPFGPRRPWISPVGTLSDTSSRATTRFALRRRGSKTRVISSTSTASIPEDSILCLHRLIA